jgi:hypothetical protein
MIDDYRDDGNVYYRCNDLRNEIQTRVLQNQKLLKLLKYTNDNALESLDISIDDAWAMVGEKKVNTETKETTGGYIFFQPRSEGTTQDDRNMLVMSTKLKVRDVNSPIVDLYVYFNVLVNYTNYELIDGTTRTNYILGSILEDFANTDGEWIGKMKFIGGDDITAPSQYHGATSVYMVSDFLGNWRD